MDATSLPCAAGTQCIDWVCAVEGVAGGPCRADAAAYTCNAGLACQNRTCRTEAAQGGFCAYDDRTPGTNCAAGLLCTRPGGAQPTCTPAAYRWTATAGATLIDACDGGFVVPFRASGGSAVQVPIPFAYAWFGGAVDGLLLGGLSAAPTLGGIPTEFASGLGQSAFRLGFGAGGTAVCVKTVGTAPNRRLVVEWLDPAAVGEALLEEGTLAIEFRYGPTAVGYGASGPYISARITEAGLYLNGTQHVSVLNARVLPGTSIRFVPR